MTLTTPIALVFGGLLLAGFAQPAAAQPYALREGYSPDSTKIVTYASVRYSDIDLASPAGARKLLRRIEDAADAVCGGPAKMTSAYETEDFRACTRTAVAGAVARVRSPALAALVSRRPTELRAAR